MKTVFEVKCRRKAYLLNRLIASGAKPQDIVRTEHGVRFCVARREAARVEAVLRKEDFSYEVSGFLGVRSLFLRSAKRPFFAAGILLVIAGVILFENFLCGYSISGNQYVNTASVAAVLKANHAEGVVWKNSVDLQEIKRQITMLEGVSFASVKIVGSRLQVEIKESLPLRYPEEKSYAPILASHSAVVTKVVAQSGTPRVQAGDYVQAGDMLIEPFYAFTEGGTEAPAAGEVWGRVTYQLEEMIPAVTVESVLTGEITRVRRVTMFGKTVGGEKAAPYDSYDLEERVIFRGIGMEVTELTYKRREKQTLYHDFEQEAPARISECVQRLLSAVPFSAKECGGVSVVQKKVDNILFIVLYYSVEQRIDSLPIAP